MRIAVIGAGATGAVMGGYLALAGHAITFVDPNEEHMRACAENGLTIRAAGFAAGSAVEEYHVNVRAMTDAASAGKADVAIFMPKGTHTRAAVPNLLAVTDENTLVLTLQNGLGNLEILAEYVPEARLAYGITSISSGLPEPGVVTPRIPAHHQIWMGSDNRGNEPILRSLADAYCSVGLEAAYDSAIKVRVWEKFALNCGVNAATAILRLTARGAAQFQDYIDIRQEVIREIDGIAKRMGIYMDPNTIFGLGDEAVPPERSKSPDTYASMAQDARAKRRTEIDNLNGYAVEQARRLGISVPYNECLTKLMHTIEGAYDLQF